MEIYFQNAGPDAEAEVIVVEVRRKEEIILLCSSILWKIDKFGI